MHFLFRSFAILLPLAGLGYSWHSTRQTAAQGVEWDVPVTGYDPRDLLRGHYVRFRYVWPEPVGMKGTDDSSAAAEICLEGQAPVIRLATRRRLDEPKAPCNGIARTARTMIRTTNSPATMVPDEGRLFIAQTDAGRLEHGLADPAQQAILHFRLRPDGEIIPMRLSFQPKAPASPQD